MSRLDAALGKLLATAAEILELLALEAALDALEAELCREAARAGFADLVGPRRTSASAHAAPSGFAFSKRKKSATGGAAHRQAVSGKRHPTPANDNLKRRDRQ
jgi:hypothetical protein